MKLALTVACLLAATSTAIADEDVGMQLITAMMRTPAISSDGKHVAIYNEDPGSEKDAMTSLGVFAIGGALEQRVSVVPPNTSVPKAKAAAAKIAKFLDDGGYKRMSRVAQASQDAKQLTYSAQLTSEDVVIDVHLEKRKLDITYSRDGKKLAPIHLALPAKDGPCKAADAYDLPNTMAGYDKKSQVFAFTVHASQGDTVCFAHSFVVALK
jgi:hypothetical protein